MKWFLSLILLFNLNFLFCQEKNLRDFPNLKLTYENEIWDSESYEWKKIKYTSGTPQMSYEFKHGSRTMLVAFFINRENNGANVIATYVNFAEIWQPVHQTEIDHGNFFKELKFFYDDNTKYVLFQYHSGGGSSGTASHTFGLYDIIQNKIHELTYSGYSAGGEEFFRVENGTFEFNGLLDYPDLLGILEAEAASSKYIVRN